MAATLTLPQRRTLAELGAELSVIDTFGAAHVRADTGRMHKIHRDGRVWNFDTRGWYRPAWAMAAA